jgi:hypothetical protein
LRRLTSVSLAACLDLGATDAGVAINLDHLPAATLGNLVELADLVLDRLRVCADSHMQCSPLHLLFHWKPRLSRDFDASNIENLSTISVFV